MDFSKYFGDMKSLCALGLQFVNFIVGPSLLLNGHSLSPQMLFKILQALRKKLSMDRLETSLLTTQIKKNYLLNILHSHNVLLLLLSL